MLIGLETPSACTRAAVAQRQQERGHLPLGMAGCLKKPDRASGNRVSARTCRNMRLPPACHADRTGDPISRTAGRRDHGANIDGATRHWADRVASKSRPVQSAKGSRRPHTRRNMRLYGAARLDTGIHLPQNGALFGSHPPVADGPYRTTKLDTNFQLTQNGALFCPYLQPSPEPKTAPFF